MKRIQITLSEAEANALVSTIDAILSEQKNGYATNFAQTLNMRFGTHTLCDLRARIEYKLDKAKEPQA